MAEAAELAAAGTAAHRQRVLEVADATKRFATPEGDVVAVQDVSFTVDRGEFVSIIGPSGCGKSTLFGMIGGLVDGWQGASRSTGRRSGRGHPPNIGMVFQEESTFPGAPCSTTWRCRSKRERMSKSERLDRAAHFVKLVGLEGFENRYPHEISGGMRQRTAIARTLAYAPDILMMDEPFGALDEQTRLLLGDTVVRIQSELKQTILLITHSIAESVQLSDRVLIMTYRPGRLKRFVRIDLPRPRSSEDVGDPRFGSLVAEIWKDLREEASRGLRESERDITSWEGRGDASSIAL